MLFNLIDSRIYSPHCAALSTVHLASVVGVERAVTTPGVREALLHEMYTQEVVLPHAEDGDEPESRLPPPRRIHSERPAASSVAGLMPNLAAGAAGAVAGGDAATAAAGVDANAFIRLDLIARSFTVYYISDDERKTLTLSVPFLPSAPSTASSSRSRDRNDRIHGGRLGSRNNTVPHSPGTTSGAAVGPDALFAALRAQVDWLRAPAAVQLQRVARGYLSREKLHRWHVAAAKIQAAARGWAALLQYCFAQVYICAYQDW